MKENVLPDTLLKGEYFHCRPIEKGPTIRIKIIQIEDERIKKLCVCGARLPRSRCFFRKDNISDLCEYWRGDGLPNGYQIVGPRAYKKSKKK